MALIGSTVIYMGTQWNNQVRGTQPVWGVKESPADDEERTGRRDGGEEKILRRILEGSSRKARRTLTWRQK